MNLQSLINDWIELSPKIFEFGWKFLALLFIVWSIWIIWLGIFKSSSTSRNISKFIQPTEPLFIGVSIIMIAILRLPTLSVLQANIDENQWMVGAMTYVDSGALIWKDLDLTTSGPLTILPLVFIYWIFGSLDYGLIRIVSIIIWIISFYCIYSSFKLFFNTNVARLITLPFLILVSLTNYWDFIAYNAEHPPVLLISIALLLICKIITSPHKTHLTQCFIVGIILGSLPLSKLQAIPIGIGGGLVLFSFLLLHKEKKSIGYLITGSILPSLTLLIYLLSINALDNFWISYVKNNLNYSSIGVRLEVTDLSIPYKIFRIPHFLTQVVETSILYLALYFIIIFGIILILKRIANLKGDLFWGIILGISLSIGAFISICTPASLFHHHLLLTVVPWLFLTGMVFGSYCNVYNIFSGDLQKSQLVLSSFVILTSILPALRTISSPHDSITKLERNQERINHIQLISKEVSQHLQSNNMMAIWGWGTQYYIGMGKIQGTSEAMSQFQIANNILNLPYAEYFLDRYCNDIIRNQPSIFLDTVHPDGFFFTKEEYKHEHFPQLKNIINKNYKFIKEVEGVRIYTRY